MVEVYKKENDELTNYYGEIISEDKKYFKIHSSSLRFNKKEFYYKTKL